MRNHFQNGFRRFTAAVTVAVLAACSVSDAAVSLPDPAVDAPAATQSGLRTAGFAGGRFWGVEGGFGNV